VGDCLEVMKKLPSNSVNLVVTSPPYNIGKDYGKGTDKDVMTWPDYYEWLGNVLRMLYRIVVTGGIVALNIPQTVRTKSRQLDGGLRHEWVFANIVPIMVDIGWLLREPLVWVKGSPGNAMASNTAMGSDSNPYLRACHEMIILASKERYYFSGRTGKRWQLPIDLCKDVWHIMGKSHKNHPAIFPEQLPESLIVLFCPDGGLVFDPFMGSGTTAVTADRLGRCYFGCDTSEEYVKIANVRIFKDRIKRSQLEMF